MRKLPPIRSWRRRTKILCAIGISVLLLGLYPVSVLGYVWIKVVQSDLPGGHNGPLDAYRHTLASAVVAYTLNERAVDWVSEFMEDEGLITQRMDIHNNRIGARIGSSATSFSEIEPAVARQIAKGRMMHWDPECSTWLPESIWDDKKMW